MWVHTEINYSLSTQIAQRIGAQPRACWRNAWRGLALLGPLALYVEGWAVANGIAIEHGWLELPAGVVIDPTLALSPDWGNGPAPVYFPGERFGAERAAAVAIERGGDLPLVYRHGWGGWPYWPYKLAHDNAWAYASGAGELAPLAAGNS